MLRFSEGFISQVSVPCFLSTCAIAPLIICFDLKSKDMFSKSAASLLYHSISVVIIANVFLFNFLSVYCNLISVEVLMILCFQTLVYVLIPTISKE